MGNEKINFEKIREPEEMDKVKRILKGLVEKAKGETFAGHAPLELREGELERAVERLRVFTSLDQFDQFREEVKGKKRPVMDKFVERLQSLGSGGVATSVYGRDSKKYRCVIVFDKSEKTLKHELQHIADKIVFGDGMVGDGSSGTSVSISKAALVGQQILLGGMAGSMLEKNYHEVQILGAAVMVFGLISVVSTLRYLGSEGEKRARGAE